MDKFIDILLQENFLSAIFSTIFVILISFILRRKNIFNENSQKVIADIVLKLALPAMAFNAFMKDFDNKELKSSFQLFIITFLIYIFLIVITKLIFIKYDKDTKEVYSLLVIFSNATFFTIPILEGIYQSDIIIPLYIVVVVFRIFLYSYGVTKMSHVQFDNKHIIKSVEKILLNPVMIATLTGLLIWITQNDLFVITTNGKTFSALRLDQSIPFLYAPITYLARVATPLSWILIGITLGGFELKESFKKPVAWVLSIMRTLVVPLVILLIVVGLQSLNIIHINKYGLISLVLVFAAPVSVVLNSYSVKYNRECYLVSDTTFLSTIIAIVLIPLFVVVVEIIGSSQLFI